MPLDRWAYWRQEVSEATRWLCFIALTFALCLIAPVAGWGQESHTLEQQRSAGDLEMLQPGVVVELVSKGWAADRAGIKKGDVLLSWSRGDSQGTIDSPFALWWLRAEQSYLGPVSLRGTRDSKPEVWTIGPDMWGIGARPNFTPRQWVVYQTRRQSVLAGRLPTANFLPAGIHFSP